MKLVDYVKFQSDKNHFIMKKNRGEVNNIIELNEVGNTILGYIEKNYKINEIVKKLLKEYEIEEEYEKQVSNDVCDFIKELKEVGLIKNDNNEEKIDENHSNSVLWDNNFFDKYLELQKYYFKENKPFRFFIELTYNCNLRCIHCYRGEAVEGYNENKEYIDKNVLFEILDELEEIGVVEIIFTGGDPFMHPDILEILEYTKDMNFIVTVLTNGHYLANENNIKKIEKFNIYDIRVSIYGTQSKHDKITSSPSSYELSEKALRNIKKYLNKGVAVFVLMNGNYSTYKDTIKHFRDLGINVSVSTSLTPTTEGSLEPLNNRITPEQYYDYLNDLKIPINGSGCSAGISRFRIEPSGNVVACELIKNSYLGNIYEESILDIINGEKRLNFIEEFRKILENHECNDCNIRKNCNFCPAVFYLENGSFNKKSEYLCDITHMKSKIKEESCQYEIEKDRSNRTFF